MVPTAEARITRQMSYSAVPPIGTASARLAMLPPVQLRPGYRGAALLIAGPSDAARHLTGRLLSLPLNPPFDSPFGVGSQVFSAGKGFGIPRSYTPPPALSRNDSFDSFGHGETGICQPISPLSATLGLGSC